MYTLPFGREEFWVWKWVKQTFQGRMKYCGDTHRVSFTVLSPVAGYLNTLLILKPDVRRPINLAPLSPSPSVKRA